jgi:hypothetical protein
MNDAARTQLNVLKSAISSDKRAIQAAGGFIPALSLAICNRKYAKHPRGHM